MSEIEALKEKWIATGSFDDEQRYLWARVKGGEVPCVEMSLGGEWPDTLAVVIRRPTDVVYFQQCTGLVRDHRLVEGFLVPTGMWKYDIGGNERPRPVEAEPFIQIFHDGEHCMYNWVGDKLPDERLEKLRRLIEDVQYARCDGYGPHPSPEYWFRLDESRIQEIAEAWIPVDTVDGPGVLLYRNCD